jgi:hypothetical protein
MQFHVTLVSKRIAVVPCRRANRNSRQTTQTHRFCVVRFTKDQHSPLRSSGCYTDICRMFPAEHLRCRENKSHSGVVVQLGCHGAQRPTDFSTATPSALQQDPPFRCSVFPAVTRRKPRQHVHDRSITSACTCVHSLASRSAISAPWATHAPFALVGLARHSVSVRNFLHVCIFVLLSADRCTTNGALPLRCRSWCVGVDNNVTGLGRARYTSIALHAIVAPHLTGA